MLNKGKEEGNMFKKSLLVLLSVLVLSGVCFAEEEVAEEPMEDTTAMAAEEPELVLEDIAICAAVENKQPVGAGTVFTDDLDKIYCFTKIGGAQDTTSINHIWYFGDKEIVKVNLAVKSVSWRTWSSKTVNMGLGKGYVEIVSEDGDVLGKAEFEIKAAPEEEAEETGEAMEEETPEPMEEEAEKPMKKEAEKTEEAGKACEDK